MRSVWNGCDLRDVLVIVMKNPRPQDTLQIEQKLSVRVREKPRQYWRFSVVTFWGPK